MTFKNPKRNDTSIHRISEAAAAGFEPMLAPITLNRLAIILLELIEKINGFRYCI